MRLRLFVLGASLLIFDAVETDNGHGRWRPLSNGGALTVHFPSETT
jgi:hypothetical protein